MFLKILESSMKLSPIVLAVVALSAATSSFAAPNAARIAISSGASATKGNLALAMGALCKASNINNVLTEFASGSNISTYVCADTAVTGGAAGTYVSKANTEFKNFAGTNFAELRLNVSGGSFTAVCALNGWTAGTSCSTVNPGGAADSYRDPATLTNVLAAAGQVIVGGLLDVSPDTWPAGVTSGLSIPSAEPTGVAQTFGVAVSDTLYTAMFTEQKADTGGATIAKPIPSSCLVTDTTKLECVPTVSKGQMATIMANNEFNDAYSRGAGFLGGATLDGTILEYNRRADTSGTQAAAQAYFLGLPCSSTQLSIVTPPAVGSSTEIGAIRVYAHSGTGDVRTRLNVAGVHGIGIMSGENNQTSSTSWKWVRVQGAPIGENAKPTAGVTNRASVINGSYDFYFESKVVPGSAAGSSAFWGAVTGTLNTLAAPVGLLNAADLGAYNKGGNACQYNAR
jgi:hypothetical protein